MMIFSQMVMLLSLKVAMKPSYMNQSTFCEKGVEVNVY